MIADLAHYALLLALPVALLQTGAALFGAHVRDGVMMRMAGGAAVAQGLLIALAFFGLMGAYVASDFSVANVYQNSHTAKPLIYKIAGVWGNHEGSMILWLLMLSGLGAAVAVFGGRLPPTLKARVIGIQGLIGAAFLAFSIFTSNPFVELSPVPAEGQDLNPLLQDPGLAFHPPFLYLGYVGFSVAFSFAVAALLEGRVNAAWARWVRPWTLLAWTSLTLGIAMGSWWAYYELGWGGYWFWDPVENASLMPWLAGTALLHSAIVVEKRETLKLWTVLMAILAFSTSLLGTFVVRSGVLTSVHAFANDPERGGILLIICAVLTGGALLLFALRGAAMAPGGSFAPLSRESALILNNVILSVLTFTVVLGTFYPLIREVMGGGRITVGPPYYTKVTTPLMIFLALVMAAGVALPWKRGNAKRLSGRMRTVAIATLAGVTAGLIFGAARSVLVIAGLFVSVWVISSALEDVVSRSRLFGVTPREAVRRMAGFPRAFWGGTLAHLGVGIAVLGMVGTSLWITESQVVMAPGESREFAGFDIRYDRRDVLQVANYNTEMSTFTLLKDGREVATLRPERRWYPVAEMATAEAATVPRWASDVYVAVGDVRGADDQARVVRLYFHPLVHFLWGGALVMVAGGVISLTDRRYRIGAPQRKTKAATAPEGVPAE